MPLEVYHLQQSQSERIVWLCEELGIDYKLHAFPRDPHTGLAPEPFKSLHSAGTAPVITDVSPSGKPVLIGESGAIVEYLVTVYGNGKLSVKPTDDGYVDYLQWLAYANGTLQPSFSRFMFMSFAGEAATSSRIFGLAKSKLDGNFRSIDERLAKSKYLAGEDLTAADIMSVFTMSTMRGFFPYDLSPYKNILRYLGDVASRKAYKDAMAKGDPELKAPMIHATVEKFNFGGLRSDSDKQ